MSYTLVLSTGEVYRDADGAVVAPAQSTDDADYLAYVAWVEAGNQPTTIPGDGAVPPVVPEAVTMRQARLALLGAGMLASVDAAIASMPGVEGAAARIEWEYAAEVVRHSPLVDGMSSALGLTSAQIDVLFVAAAQL